MSTDKVVHLVGWSASIMAILMYSSYIDQIRRNLEGKPGSLILALATILNCSAWSLYAILKPRVDWPILVCNLLGIVLGAITAVTTIYQF